jgi:hypothetical protein
MSFTITTGLIDADFQIDFVGVQESELDSELFYRAYGDMGNIIGRITSYYGVKFGGRGLWVDYEFKSASGKLATAKIMLTSQPVDICNFLGLDYRQYQGEFETEKDMFRWIETSSWFYKDAFRILNGEYRHRVKKRPGYQHFMQYLGIVNQSIMHADSETIDVVHSRWRQDAAIEYFKKELEKQAAIDEKNLIEARQSKFNGTHFISLGFTKGDIGRQIIEFKRRIAGEDVVAWNAWLDSQPDYAAVAACIGQIE